GPAVDGGSMRRDSFLRTPIRGDHQNRLQNIQVSEVALSGNPPAAAPFYPQTLEITFDPAPGVTEVQIAPLWEGTLRFLPESSAGNPTDPAQVTRASFPGWSVTGDLLLLTPPSVPGSSSLDEAFAAHVPLVRPAPNVVRYSQVHLTPDFLFTTLT